MGCFFGSYCQNKFHLGPQSSQSGIQRKYMTTFQSMLFDLFYNIRMARNQTVTSTVHNIFALNRVKKECYYEPIRVDFSPVQKPNNPIESIIPFFNCDNNYFTPAFILKREKISLEENVLSEKNKFEARISHSQKLTQDETPEYRPTDSKYCQLCRTDFSDYWEHINDKYHKRMINSSKFNRDIIALCQSFERQDRSENVGKTKKIQKKKGERKAPKSRDLKSEDKATNLSENKMCEQRLKGQFTKGKGAKIEHGSLMEHRNPEQSLKIMLQLGNYSTNLLSNNTFKQLCREG